MKKTIVMALAILIFGSAVMSGCYIGPPWWDDDHDEGWHHRHGERWERHGALMPQDGRQGNAPARPGGDGRNDG